MFGQYSIHSQMPIFRESNIVPSDDLNSFSADTLVSIDSVPIMTISDERLGLTERTMFGFK